MHSRFSSLGIVRQSWRHVSVVCHEFTIYWRQVCRSVCVFINHCICFHNIRTTDMTRTIWYPAVLFMYTMWKVLNIKLCIGLTDLLSAYLRWQYLCTEFLFRPLDLRVQTQHCILWPCFLSNVHSTKKIVSRPSLRKKEKFRTSYTIYIYLCIYIHT